MATAQRIAIVVTPVLAIATLAVGLRIGAGRTIHAALLYGAPRAHGSKTLSWQLVTLVDENGVRETEKRTNLTVHATSKGATSTWTGDTNDDGVAEIRLDLPNVVHGDPIDVEVLASDGISPNDPLAKGRAVWDDVAWRNEAPSPFARPSKREGAIALDVAVLGEKLVARSDAPILVRATARDDGHPLSNVTLVPEPDPGLDVRQPSAVTCPLGWGRLDASSRIYIAALALHATLPDGRTGEWYGALPVAPGSIHAALEDVAKDHADVTIFGSSVVYAEIDDDEGRAFATSVPLPGPTGERATFSTPPLSPGLKWLVTSSEPRGAEVLDEGTIARPFLVEGKPMPAGLPTSDDPCAVRAALALHPSGGFHRWLAFDGFLARKDESGVRRQRGLAIALGSLAIASVLELVLLLNAARAGRRLTEAALSEMDGGEGALMKRSGVGSVIVGVVLALLGFGLLAALIIAHG